MKTKKRTILPSRAERKSRASVTPISQLETERRSSTRRIFSFLVSRKSVSALYDLQLNSAAARKLVENNGSRKYILTPESKSIRRWDIVCSIGLVYTATLTPFDIAFRSDVNEFDMYFWVNRVVDMIFLFDMVINFTLAYRGNDDEGGHYIFNRKLIALHYLKGWFTLDIVSILPFDIVAAVLSTNGTTLGTDIQFLKIMKLFRLAKLARIVRIIRIFRRFEDHLSLSFAFQSILKFVFTVLVMCHWLACTWRITAEVEESASSSWYIEEGYSSLPATDVYITCLYWATTTVTTIGYGNAANPVTTYERGVAIFCMCFGAACWAYVIGAISGIVSSFNTHELEYRETMDVLNDFMNYRRLPNELRVRLRAFFRFRRTMMRDQAYFQLFESMSPALRGEVASHTNREWLAKVPWAREGSPAFITSVSMAIEPAVFAPKELVEVGKLNIATRGILARGGQIFTSGGVWGIDVLLTSPQLKHSTPARALTFVQVFQLDRATLFRIIDKFPVEKVRLRRCALWMALRRGIIVYSKVVRSVLRNCRRVCSQHKNEVLLKFQECDPQDEGVIHVNLFAEILQEYNVYIVSTALPTLQRMCDYELSDEGIRDEDLEPIIDYMAFINLFSTTTDVNILKMKNGTRSTATDINRSKSAALKRKVTFETLLEQNPEKKMNRTGVIDAFSTQDELKEITGEKAPVFLRTSTASRSMLNTDAYGETIQERLDEHEQMLEEILQIVRSQNQLSELARLVSQGGNGPGIIGPSVQPRLNEGLSSFRKISDPTAAKHRSFEQPPRVKRYSNSSAQDSPRGKKTSYSASDSPRDKKTGLSAQEFIAKKTKHVLVRTASERPKRSVVLAQTDDEDASSNSARMTRSKNRDGDMDVFEIQTSFTSQ